MLGSSTVQDVEDEAPCIFRGASGARPGKLAAEEARRAAVWEALWDLGAARRSASQTLLDNTSDTSLVEHLLDGLQALEAWRVVLLTELGLPDNVIRIINNYLSLLEGTRLSPEEGRRLLLIPQVQSVGLAARKWTPSSGSK